MFNYSSFYFSRAFLQAFIEFAKPSKMIGYRIKLFQICDDWETRLVEEVGIADDAYDLQKSV